MTDFTKSEKKIMDALGWGPLAKDWRDLRVASGLTIRGFRTVIHRLEDAGYIGRNEGIGLNFHMTFKGARAMGLAGQPRAVAA